MAYHPPGDRSSRRPRVRFYNDEEEYYPVSLLCNGVTTETLV